jgi:hypothetical protein
MPWLAERGSRGIAPLMLNLGIRWGLVVNATSRPLYPREIPPVSILQEAGCAWGPFLTSTENLALTGFRTSDRPARSDSLYRLKGKAYAMILLSVYPWLQVLNQPIDFLESRCKLGTRWRNWLRHCATRWKVAGSIPDGVTGIFHWHSPSGRIMA